MKIVKRRFILIWTAVMLTLFAVIAVFSINSYVKWSVKDLLIAPDEAILSKADCIIVLGAGVWGDSPSPMLQDRLLVGIELYHNGASERLLMSGDHGRKDYDEVNVMKQFAIDRGVKSEHIFMDHAGFDTYNSIYRAKEIFQTKKIIIVTQGYHLYRALYIAKALGLDAGGVASDPRTYLGQEGREMREILARVKDFFKVMLKPAPIFLGDTIPVSGNGDLTNDRR